MNNIKDKVRAASLIHTHIDTDDNGHKRITLTLHGTPSAELIKTTIEDILKTDIVSEQELDLVEMTEKYMRSL